MQQLYVFCISKKHSRKQNTCQMHSHEQNTCQMHSHEQNTCQMPECDRFFRRCAAVSCSFLFFIRMCTDAGAYFCSVVVPLKPRYTCMHIYIHTYAHTWTHVCLLFHESTIVQITMRSADAKYQHQGARPGSMILTFPSRFRAGI